MWKEVRNSRFAGNEGLTLSRVYCDCASKAIAFAAGERQLKLPIIAHF
jgi:hypothetical protein